MHTRRAFLAASAAAPAVLRGASTRTLDEIEKILASGNVKGRLTREDIPTPALMLDLDAFEHNVARMTKHLKDNGKAFRPHGKTHKCAEIARRLIQAGAVGACAAKISEAEAFAREGIGGLLVTSAPVGRLKIERALRLARLKPDTIFSVDNAQNVRELNDAAGAARIKFNLAVDLAVSSRTGITPGEPGAALAQLISTQPNLVFKGIQAYAGHSSHVIGFEARRKSSQEAMGRAVETRRMIESRGIECKWLSGGSTGTYNIDSSIDGITELQPGSFMFMDVDYNRIGGQDGEVYRDFKNSLTVATTVISKPADDAAIVDGGLKAFSTDKPFTPVAKGIDNLPYNWAGDEHGKLNLARASRAVNLGDRIEFVIPHCDPSVNLYDRMFCLRGDTVEAVWRITARGLSQ